MNKEISRLSYLQIVLSVILTLLGFILLFYMILMEDEPGAVPLALIAVGAGWYFINRIRLKNTQK